MSGLNCNAAIRTGNSSAIFAQVGASCTPDNRNWWAPDQPSWVVLSSDPNYGKCLGWQNVPGGVLCGGSNPDVRRVCRCDAPSRSVMTFGEKYALLHSFQSSITCLSVSVGVLAHRCTGADAGTGVSSYYISTQEQFLFSHFVASPDVGYLVNANLALHAVFR